jgi:glutamate dehydrogenase
MCQDCHQFNSFFRDIARGGVRIIRSQNKTIYDQNSASLFEENYNLAYTQQQKNKGIILQFFLFSLLFLEFVIALFFFIWFCVFILRVLLLDIPEGGSKGTILLTQDHQSKVDVAFRKYIDGLLDLLLPCDELIDYYGKEEILFLGPDEGTADYMDWGIFLFLSVSLLYIAALFRS